MQLSPRQTKLFRDAMYCDPQIVDRTISEIFSTLEAGVSLNEFSMAWGKAPQFMKRMVIAEIEFLAKGVMKGVTQETDPAAMTQDQREAISSVLLKAGDAFAITMARQVFIRDYRESFVQSKAVA